MIESILRYRKNNNDIKEITNEIKKLVGKENMSIDPFFNRDYGINA